MLSFIRNTLSKLRTRRLFATSLPEGYFFGRRDQKIVQTPEEALTLSPVFAALRLYQTTLSSLPLITYRSTGTARDEARLHPAFHILNSKPNPAQTRNTMMQVVARELFLHGEAFLQVRWRGNNSLFGLYPVTNGRVQEIVVDDEWSKLYAVRMDDQSVEVIEDSDMLHIVAFPDQDGIRGVSFLKYAYEALGLHKQVQESATAYYRNAAKPSGYVKYSGKLTPEALNAIKENFKAQYQGTDKAGSIPLLEQGGEFVTLNGTSAEDAQIIQALGNSVGDVARWAGISALVLGDFSSAKYGSLAAENQSLFQKSFRWLLEAIEAELNNKLFGAGSEFFAEFDTSGILRGDPLMQAQIHQTYLTSGVMTRNEVRDSLNLPAIPELDTPLAPLNQGNATVPPTSPAQLPPDQGGDGKQLLTQPQEVAA